MQAVITLAIQCIRYDFEALAQTAALLSERACQSFLASLTNLNNQPRSTCAAERRQRLHAGRSERKDMIRVARRAEGYERRVSCDVQLCTCSNIRSSFL
jgi:hypothetical protein